MVWPFSDGLAILAGYVILIVPITSDGGDKSVGVNEAHDKQIHFLPAEQGIDAGGQVTGWLDRKFHQAIAGAVH